MKGQYPILTCEEAKVFEAEHFGSDETREWAAMQTAGRALAAAIAEDFGEIGGWPTRETRVLVLAGKGHNAGDALIAAETLHARFGSVTVDVVFAFGARALRPLARRAWDELSTRARRVRADGSDWAASYDLCLDGMFGFQFRPPLQPEAAALLARVNAWPARMRVAVDLPSGLDDASAFRADFTYATGIVKTPLLELPNAGRVRFLDLGFFNRTTSDGYRLRGLGDDILAELGGWRAARSDKRTFGHLLVVAGSRRYPGAALMATEVAVRAGTGLVTAAVPESLVPTFAARLPEVMWLGLPETPDGGLALEGLAFVREAFGRATAVLIGPGLGRERETLALAAEVAKLSPRPLVIDADALQPEIVAAGNAARVLTPHAGEFARIETTRPAGAVTVRKGPLTTIETVGVADAPVHHVFFGGPVLARGGSGDLLAGLIGGLLAQAPQDVLLAAARGAVWHGRAADLLAQSRGAQAVRTTELLDFLGSALRKCAA